MNNSKKSCCFVLALTMSMKNIWIIRIPRCKHGRVQDQNIRKTI